jgi:hypothetical protein
MKESKKYLKTKVFNGNLSEKQRRKNWKKLSKSIGTLIDRRVFIDMVGGDHSIPNDNLYNHET